MSEDKPTTRLQERFVRWQDNLRQSLSTHVALIVAFSSGGLGFVGSTLNADHARLSGCTPWLILAAGFPFLVSLFLALFISCHRLEDVRATLAILSHRRDKSSDEVMAELQHRTDTLGKRTWKLVHWQLGIFTVAAALFSAGIFFAFEHRLLPSPESAEQQQTK